MKKSIYKIFIVLISLLILPYSSFGNVVSAEEQQNNNNSELVNSLSDYFNISSSEISNQINEGYSIVEIQSALLLAKSTGESFEGILEQSKPKIINNSNDAESEIVTDLGTDYQFSTLADSGTTAPTIDPGAMLSKITAKASEAPYTVNLNNESISTISGGLTYTDVDAYLPGRGGLSFALNRTYNSQSAQFNEMKIGESANYQYVVQYNVNLKKYQETYKAITNMRRYYELDNGCDGVVDYSSPSTSVEQPAIESGWLLTSAAAQNYNFSPNLGSWSTCTWSGGGGVDPGTTPPPTTPPPTTPPPTTPPPSPNPPPKCTGICEYAMPNFNVLSGTSSRDRTSYYPEPKQIASNSTLLSSSNVLRTSEYFATYQEAQNRANQIVAKQGQLESPSSRRIEGNITVYDQNIYSGQPQIVSVPVAIQYFNDISQPTNEKMFPIGKGWSWNIPSVETKVVSGISKQFVHMEDGSVSEIEDNKLKGNIWNDYTFLVDTSINTADFKSKYVLKSINGVNQYFNDQGQLILISNTYGNEIKFYYQNNSLYGSVLSTIKDDIGNTINITYSKDDVIITNGPKQTKYKKINVNGKELLSQVITPSGLTTTYSYSIKQALFNLFGTTPQATNPYALLTKITHPTGAETIYEYDDIPVNRLLSSDSVNQSYKLKKRYDMFQTTSGPSINQVREYQYDGDPYATVNADVTFKTTVLNGQTSTDYFMKKKFYDSNKGDAFYTTEVNENGRTTSKITINTYDEVKRNPYPIQVQKKNKVTISGVTSFSPVVTSTTQYNDYGLISSNKEDIVTNTYEYTLKNVSLPKDSKTRLFNLVLPSKITSLKEKSLNGADQTVLSTLDYVQNTDGNVTSKVETLTSNNKVIGKTESQFNSEGNINKLIQYKSYESDTVNEKVTHEVIYSQATNYAYPSEYRVGVTNVDGVKSTIVKKFEYDTSNGNLTKSVDGNNNETYYQYDLEDRVNKVIYKDPTKTLDLSPNLQYTYNDLLNEIVTTDELGERTKEKWNPLGWKIATYSEYNQVYRSQEQFEYDQYGRQIRTIDANGNSTTSVYDEWIRPLTVYDADYNPTTGTGGKTSYSYNDITFENQTTDNENNSTIDDFDEYGKLQTKKESWKDSSSILQSKSTEKYTYVGDDYTVEDSLGTKTAYDYDWSNKLTTVKVLPNQTQTNTETTNYTYDLLGNLVKLTTANNQSTVKTFDELGRVIKITKPSGKIEKSYFDSNNNLLKKIDQKNNTTTYEYNFRNLVSKRQVTTPQAGQDTLQYQYDVAGRVTSRTDSTGTTSYQYYSSTDAEPDKNIGAVKKMTLPDGSFYQYYYTITGNREAIDLNIAGNTPWRINYTYDGQDRMQSVSSPNEQLTQSYTYTKNSQIQKASISNHTEAIFSYENGLKSTLNDKLLSNGNSINSYEFKYDANENMTSIKTNEIFDTFQYDAQDRITSSTINNQVYTYDSVGNREMELSEDEIDQSTLDYEYTALNELKKVTIGSQTVNYVYDGDGLLYERKENGITTRYYYDGQDVIAEATVTNGVPTLKARYLRGAQGLIARISEDSAEKSSYGGIAYYHFNGHGDVVFLLDKQGNLLNKYSYDVWGKPLSAGTSESIKNPFRYSGEYWDNTTNLQFLRARWYDPNIGRFISEDSYEGEINNPLSLNRYTYVENNPLTHWDPSGHIPVHEAGNGESYPYSVDQMFKIIDSKAHPLTWRDKAAIYDYMIYNKLTPEDIADGFLIVGSVGKGGKGKKAADKPTNLPSYKKVDIDMEHVMSGHTKGGKRANQSGIKDLFPENMSEKQIEKAIRDAYKNGKRIRTQGDKVLVQGYSNGMKIEMWVNTKTKIIETAYPKKK